MAPNDASAHPAEWEKLNTGLHKSVSSTVTPDASNVSTSLSQVILNAIEDSLTSQVSAVL